MKPATLKAGPFLIVPGFHGSGPDHWQSWLESQLPDCARIGGIDWEQPVLAQWASRIREELASATQPLWVIAHSFGSLAAVVAAADRPKHIAQLVLVAPADPDRFDCMGLKLERSSLAVERFSLGKALPLRPLQVNGVVVASRNDPWLGYDKAAALARQWGLALYDAGPAGHINAESGHGEWPELLTLLHKRSRKPKPPVITAPPLRKGRGSALAAVRQLTREQLQSPQDHRLWQ